MTTTPTSLLQARRAWPGLSAPAPEEVEGLWEASFLTPLRTVAPLGLGLIGLPRWHGKRLTAGSGINLVRSSSGALTERLPLQVSTQRSWSDGNPTLVASYAADARRPWRWVRDELRLLEPDVMPGMTFTDAPGLRRMGLPFLLTRRGRDLPTR